MKEATRLKVQKVNILIYFLFAIIRDRDHHSTNAMARLIVT